MSIGAGGALQSPSILSVSDRKVPRSHVQFVAPAYDVDFSGQGIQLPLPLVFLYVPAGHSKIKCQFRHQNRPDFVTFFERIWTKTACNKPKYQIKDEIISLK